MSRTNGFSAEQVIKAIQGSGGIKTTIAKRLGCSRTTIENYLRKMPTVKQAYDEENEKPLDMARSVVYTNIQLGYRRQMNEGVTVDSSDAKWLLARKDRDFIDKQEVINIDTSQLTDEQLERLINGDNVKNVTASD